MVNEDRKEPMTDYMTLAMKFIKQHEGWRGVAYNDLNGLPINLGCLLSGSYTHAKTTIGYGFNIEDLELPKEVADIWLQFILRNILREVRNAFPAFSRLSPNRKAVILDMAYNMGVPRLVGFKNMWNALQCKDWKRAHAEALDSKWHRNFVSMAGGKEKITRSWRMAEVLLTNEVDYEYYK